AVGVPGERALVGVLAARIAVLVEIRESIKLREAVGVILVHHVNLHFAEVPPQCNLTRRRQLLWREQQYLIAQECLVDGAENLIAYVFGQIDARDLGAELRRQRTCGKRQTKVKGGAHGSSASIMDRYNRFPWGS